MSLRQKTPICWKNKHYTCFIGATACINLKSIRGVAPLTKAMIKRNTKKTKKKLPRFLYIIGFSFCLMALAGIVCLHFQAEAIREQQKAAIAAQKEHEEALRLAREARKAEIQALFDAYLNAFKSELVQKANAYKKSRRLLKDISKPINFRSTEFAKENYTLFKESLAPSLRSQAEDILSLFERYSQQIHSDLAQDDNDLQQIFYNEWKEMTQAQLDHYVGFFAKEDLMIDAYDDLITFYYTHSRRYSIDEETNRFIFSNTKDAEQARLLILEIDKIKKIDKGL